MAGDEVVFPEVKGVIQPFRRNWPEDAENDFITDICLITSPYLGAPATQKIMAMVEQQLNDLIEEYKGRGFTPLTDEGFLTKACVKFDEKDGTMSVGFEIEPFLKLVVTDE